MTSLGNLDPTWDLEIFFPGGSQSPDFTAFLTNLEQQIATLRQQVAAATAPRTLAEANDWSRLLTAVQTSARHLRQAGAFVSCLSAQDMKDTTARLHSGRTSQLGAALGAVYTLLDSQLSAIPEDVWAEFLAQPEWAPVAGPLAERRSRAARKMAPELETLAGDLKVDGYHAWGRLYDTIVGRISIPWEEGDKTVSLSAGQLANKLSHRDSSVRERAFTKWQAAWGAEADLCAEALNHIGGFRLALYKHRGWDSVLEEPLETNRMTEETLRVMWDVIERNKAPLVQYMHLKAALLGLEKLGWQDQGAPVSKVDRTVTYEEAAEFIVEQFGRFSPSMAEFAGRNFKERWIEAENRAGKRPGGFCTSFPLSGQSRIFLTFAGNPGNVMTLAHELGHGWHHQVMRDLPFLAQGYAMNVAETASTFAELIMIDARLRHANTDAERLVILDDKLKRGIAFCMNIHARFQFEQDFYTERKAGMLSAERLNQLMEQAQRRAYCDSLSSYEPSFWASKLHFYLTHQPFYNFPYTFGYLFSSGIYARAKEEGPGFERKYEDLLRDTGRMRVEALANKHLGVDLTRPEFWQSALDLMVADAREFVRLTASPQDGG